jgi:TonB dependent receptor
VVNGVEVNNLNVSASAIQQIKINQDPYSAEYPRPGRGRIEVVLKPGSMEYHGTGNFIFRDARFDERNAFAAVKPPEQRRIFEGFLSGPVRRSDRTSFMLSLKDNADDAQAIVFARTLAGTVQQNVASPYRNILAAATLNHQRGDSTTMSLTLSYQDQTAHNQGVGGVTLPSAGTNWNFIEQAATYTQQTIVSPKLLNQLRLFVGQEFEPTTSVSTAPRLVVLDAFTGGGAQADNLRTEHHFTLTEMISWSPRRHVVKAGINIPDWSRRRLDDNTNSGGTFYFSSLGDFAAERPYAFIQQAGNGHVVFLEKVVGLFVQDEIRVSSRLSASIGLRYDWQNYLHDHNNFGPRGSMAFAPAADGRTVIRAGAGIFYDRTGPRPIQDVLRYDGVRQLRFVIDNPSYPNPFLPGQTLSSEPPSTVQFAPDVVIPWMLQASVGIERQLRKDTSAGITYIRSRGFDQFRSRDVNAPPPPLFAVRPDPTRGVVRQLESAGKFVANSLQFTLRGKVSRFVSTQAQYTLSKAMNDTSGINWMPPNSYDLSHEYARSDFDQRHRVDLLGTVNPGSLFNIGVALALYSGRPYSITTGRDDFNTGVANARPAGVPRNSAHGPAYADLDLRWSRDLFFDAAKKGAGPTATLGVDAFNVVNRVNYSSYVGTLTSPFFGTAVAALPPRRLQLSLRMRF